MSSTYSGDPANVTPSDPTDITIPSDGDALNVASVNTAFEKLTDIAAILRTGYTTDTDPQFQTTTAPTGIKLLWRVAMGGGIFLRMYAGGSGAYAWTYNCVVTTGGTPYARDAGGSDSYLFTYGATGAFYGKRLSGDPSPWGNADWSSLSATDTSGAFTALTTITAGTGITATTGGITASAGNVTAAGTPVGSTGPGLLKGVRRYSTGTALATSDVGSVTGFGAGGSCSAVAGNDSDCLITISAAVGGGGGFANPASFVLTYKQGTWTTAPIVDVHFKNATGADGAPYGHGVHWTVTATAVTVYFDHTPVDATNYEFVIRSSSY